MTLAQQVVLLEWEIWSTFMWLSLYSHYFPAQGWLVGSAVQAALLGITLPPPRTDGEGYTEQPWQDSTVVHNLCRVPAWVY